MDSKSKTLKLNVDESPSMTKVKSSTSMNHLKSSTSMNHLKSSTSISKLKSSTTSRSSNRLNISTTNANIKSGTPSTIQKYNSTTNALELGGDYNRYLGKTVGAALAQCLNELVQTYPEDPIQFIAQWLYKYIDCEMYYKEKRTYLKDLRAVSIDMERMRKKRIVERLKMKEERAELKRQALDCVRKSIFAGTSEGTVIPDFGAHFDQMSARAASARSAGTSAKSKSPAMKKNSILVNKSLQIMNAKSSPHFDANGDLVLEFDENGDRNSEYDLCDSLDEDEVLVFDENGMGKKSTHQAISTYQSKSSKAGWNGREHLMSMGGRGSLFQFDEFTDESHISPGRSPGNRMSKRKSLYRDTSQDDMFKIADGCASWGVSARFGLVCQHPVLGDMEPRANLIYPETPAWWDQQGYLPETLYDHEVYSRPNDDKYANYDAMDHMHWKDFIEPGQWLDRRLLKNANLSYKNLVQKIPDEKKKRIRKPREGDYFPPESEDYRDGELRRERAEDRELKKKVQADVKKTSGKGGKK